MKKTARKVVHIFLGIFLILVGIIGLVLPILNGVIPLILGFIILSFESTFIDSHLRKITSKHALLAKWHEKLEAFVKRILKA